MAFYSVSSVGEKDEVKIFQSRGISVNVFKLDVGIWMFLVEVSLSQIEEEEELKLGRES